MDPSEPPSKFHARMDGGVLTKVENFRDFGSYAIAGGGHVMSGRLFRSGHLAAATAGDIRYLSQFDFTLIVDLRRPGERAAHPTGSWTTARRMISSDIGGDDDPWLLFLRRGDLTPHAFRRFAAEFYSGAAFEERHIDLFRQTLQALADDTGNVLIHCAAGKDRTGILVALIHALLGVSREDIVSDYLLTAAARTYESHGMAVSIGLEAIAGARPTAEAVRVAMGVYAEDMERHLRAIETRCGSIDAYARDILGIDEATCARIRQRFSTSPAGARP